MKVFCLFKKTEPVKNLCFCGKDGYECEICKKDGKYNVYEKVVLCKEHIKLECENGSFVSL